MMDSTLTGMRVGISISESEDMETLGFGMEHLEDAMTETARHLLANGATIVYGGDLRGGGFTELMLEFVERYRRGMEKRVMIENYLAWPVWQSIYETALPERRRKFGDFAHFHLMPSPKESESVRPPTSKEWSEALTQMRREMVASIDALVVMGGRTSGYRGTMPGILEESELQLSNNKPLYVMGGFGGCAAIIAGAMRLGRPIYDVPSLHEWIARVHTHFEVFYGGNGLTEEENRVLAETTHPDQALALIMRGLQHVRRASPDFTAPRIGAPPQARSD